MRKTSVVGALLALLLMLSSCRGGAEAPAQDGISNDTGAPGASQCPDAPGPITGPIVFGSKNNLLAMAETGGATLQLTNVTEGIFTYEPAWSPDGQRLAFTFARPLADPALSWLPIGTICGMDRATGKGRTLARSNVATESLTEPVWTPDGRALLLTMHQPQLDANGQFTGDQMSIVRYDLESGVMQQLVKNGYSPTVSPDGTRIAYLQIDLEDLGLDLMVADQNAQRAQVVEIDAGLGLIVAPRWSPDGRSLLFTASGGKAETALRPRRSLLDRLLGIDVAYAHGPPAELWLLDAPGGDAPQKPRQLTKKGLDDPHGAWGPAGKNIAYINGYGGVVLLDVVTGAEQRLSDQGDYGGITWASR